MNDDNELYCTYLPPEIRAARERQMQRWETACWVIMPTIVGLFFLYAAIVILEQYP